AGTVSVSRAANGTGGTPAGLITFDTGTFTATSLTLTGQQNANNIPNGVTGTFTLGGPTPDSAATGVLNVNTTFRMIDRNQAAGTTPLTAVFNINGGTANIFSDISVV